MGEISGDLKKWHTITINFTSPTVIETDNFRNQFLDYRLHVTLTELQTKSIMFLDFLMAKAKGTQVETSGVCVLKFRDASYWLKSGTDSPENLMGYEGFGNILRASHGYSYQIADWNTGDPD